MSQAGRQESAVDPEFQALVLDAYKKSVDAGISGEGQWFDESDSYDDDYTDESEDEIDHDSNNLRLWRILSDPIITVLVGPSEQPFHIHKTLLCNRSLFFRHMLRSDRFPESKENLIKLPQDDAKSFAVFAEYLYVGDECDTAAILLDIQSRIGTDKWESTTNEANGSKTSRTENDAGTEGSNAEENEQLAEDLPSEEDRQQEVDQQEAEQQQEEPEGDQQQIAKVDYSSSEFYDFMLQFSCYVLADKLQATGFKRLIMDEIRCHGESCNPVDLTMECVRYVYDNTVRRNDPLRRFCVMV